MVQQYVKKFIKLYAGYANCVLCTHQLSAKENIIKTTKKKTKRVRNKKRIYIILYYQWGRMLALLTVHRKCTK